MTVNVRQMGLRAIRKHPEQARRMSLFAVRHWRVLAAAVAAWRRFDKSTLRARDVLADPAVNAETAAALSELSAAAKRVRKIGLSRAVHDAQVGDRLARASGHARRAAGAAAHPHRRRHRTRRTLLTSLSLGLAGATAYAASRTHSNFNER